MNVYLAVVTDKRPLMLSNKNYYVWEYKNRKK